MSNSYKNKQSELNASLVKAKLVGNGSLGSKGIATPIQITKAGVISGLDTSEFALNGSAFLVKNDGAAAVSLSVKYAHNDSFITTSFSPGWNPDVIVAIESNEEIMTLLWGQ